MIKNLQLLLFERLIIDDDFNKNKTLSFTKEEKEDILKKEYIKSIKNNIEEIIKTRNTVFYNKHFDTSVKDQLNLTDDVRYSAPFFGINAFDSVSLNLENINEILEKIKITIENFEPRIENVNVVKNSIQKGLLKIELNFTIKNIKEDIMMNLQLSET